MENSTAIPQSGVSDNTLVRQALSGSQEAYSDLYKRYAGFLNNVFLARFKSKEAEDLVQETFLHAFKHLDKFRFQSKFSTWLFRIALNTALMDRRKEFRVCQGKVTNLIRMESISIHDVDGNELETHISTRDMVLEGVVDRIFIEQLIEDMPSSMKSHFVSYYIDGNMHQETSEILGCSIGNCKSQAHKGKLYVQKKLELLKKRSLLINKFRRLNGGTDSGRSSKNIERIIGSGQINRCNQ